jgi:hypothetical protein
MRKSLTTAALLLAFSCPALAGEMHTPGSPEPPPPTTTAVQEPTGGEPLPGEVATPGVTEAVTQTMLELLAVLPSLL